MALREVLISDEQWARIEPHIPNPPPQPRGGRPWRSDRACFEAIVWMARSGARWKDLPADFPSPSTCWRRLRDWEEHDVFKDMWRAFLEELDEQGLLQWDEVFIDGTFAPAKKGDSASERPSGAREQSAWWWPMVRVYLSEFSPHLRHPQRSNYWSQRLRR
jgi:transposase